MAFTFVVEDGNGYSDANSYSSEEYADDYAVTNAALSPAWLALTSEEKQGFLVRFSRYADQTVDWAGTKTDRDSGLRWPRAGVYDQDGFEIPDDEIPDLLKQAVCEGALYLAGGDDYTSNQGTRGFKQIEVDVINLRFNDDYVRASMPDYIIEMLEPFGTVKRGNSSRF